MAVRNLLPQSADKDAAVVEQFERFFELMKDQYAAVFSKWYQPRQMCMSAEAMLAVLDVIEPNATICDMGAGVSSWILRHHFDKVATLESNEDYAHVLRTLFLTEGLPDEHIYTDMADVPVCDYVIFDYMDMGQRKAWLPHAWKRAKVAMFVDDTDAHSNLEYRKWYRRDVYEFAVSERCITLDVPYTVDQWGRWGTWLMRGKHVIDKIRDSERFKLHTPTRRSVARRKDNPRTWAESERSGGDQHDDSPDPGATGGGPGLGDDDRVVPVGSV